MHSSDLANLAFRMFAKNLHANDDQHMPAMEKGKIQNKILTSRVAVMELSGVRGYVLFFFFWECEVAY